jgi:hypothetical protein
LSKTSSREGLPVPPTGWPILPDVSDDATNSSDDDTDDDDDDEDDDDDDDDDVNNNDAETPVGGGGDVRCARLVVMSPARAFAGFTAVTWGESGSVAAAPCDPVALLADFAVIESIMDARALGLVWSRIVDMCAEAPPVPRRRREPWRAPVAVVDSLRQAHAVVPQVTMSTSSVPSSSSLSSASTASPSSSKAKLGPLDGGVRGVSRARASTWAIDRSPSPGGGSGSGSGSDESLPTPPLGSDSMVAVWDARDPVRSYLISLRSYLWRNGATLEADPGVGRGLALDFELGTPLRDVLLAAAARRTAPVQRIARLFPEFDVLRSGALIIRRGAEVELGDGAIGEAHDGELRVNRCLFVYFFCLVWSFRVF